MCSLENIRQYRYLKKGVIDRSFKYVTCHTPANHALFKAYLALSAWVKPKA